MKRRYPHGEYGVSQKPAETTKKSGVQPLVTETVRGGSLQEAGSYS